MVYGRNQAADESSRDVAYIQMKMSKMRENTNDKSGAPLYSIWLYVKMWIEKYEMNRIRAAGMRFFSFWGQTNNKDVVRK